MRAGYRCPYCKETSACSCASCITDVNDGELIISFTEDGNGLICGNPECQKIFSHDQALDELNGSGLNEWWGYLHIKGTLQAKRYFDPMDLIEAGESPFCKKVVGPFLARDRDHALKIVEILTLEITE